MKKKISLPVMAVSAILLLGGCGTQMYDLSEDEENLVVQYSAHILAKYNIEQKDGMTAASSEETQETQKQDSQMPESQNTQSTDNNMASDATGETQTQEMETMPIAEAIGHASGLTVSYKGYRVQNIYQEGDYFAVTPEDGNKLVVMKFEIKIRGRKRSGWIQKNSVLHFMHVLTEKQDKGDCFARNQKSFLLWGNHQGRKEENSGFTVSDSERPG